MGSEAKPIRCPDCGESRYYHHEHGDKRDCLSCYPTKQREIDAAIEGATASLRSEVERLEGENASAAQAAFELHATVCGERDEAVAALRRAERELLREGDRFDEAAAELNEARVTVRALDEGRDKLRETSAHLRTLLDRARGVLEEHIYFRMDGEAPSEALCMVCTAAMAGAHDPSCSLGALLRDIEGEGEGVGLKCVSAEDMDRITCDECGGQCVEPEGHPCQACNGAGWKPPVPQEEREPCGTCGGDEWVRSDDDDIIGHICPDCGDAFEANRRADWRDRLDSQRRPTCGPEKATTGCDYCAGPLDAREGVGQYECPWCIARFPTPAPPPDGDAG